MDTRNIVFLFLAQLYNRNPSVITSHNRKLYFAQMFQNKYNTLEYSALPRSSKQQFACNRCWRNGYREATFYTHNLVVIFNAARCYKKATHTTPRLPTICHHTECTDYSWILNWILTFPLVWLAWPHRSVAVWDQIRNNFLLWLLNKEIIYVIVNKLQPLY